MTSTLIAPSQVTQRLRTGRETDAVTELSAEGVIHIVGLNQQRTLPSSPILDDIHTVWNPAHFNVRREPIVVGSLATLLPEPVTSPVRASTLPIKLPGTDYRLPSPLQWLAPFIKVVADTEAQVNPYLDQYYAYLRLDLAFVTAGECQRAPGAHSDSVHGPSSAPDDTADHMYIAVSSDPTAYFVQPFDLQDTPPTTHFLNPIFDRLADWDTAQFFNPNDVVLIDAYCVHSAVKGATTGWRCFAGISFSTRRYERIGNSHNPCFDYDWPQREYPLPAGLVGGPDSPPSTSTVI